MKPSHVFFFNAMMKLTVAIENEQMLKPHLHKIVNKSMELAMTAKEPYNYFLLLRALFRSIGKKSHVELATYCLKVPSLERGDIHW